MVQMVEANKEFLQGCLVSVAKRTRELLNRMGCPSISDLKYVIKMNSLKNCPVTTNDIELTKRIYGPDVEYSKGCQWPTPVLKVSWNPKRLVASQQIVNLFMATSFLKLAFLATVSKARTCYNIPNRKVVKNKMALARVIRQYTNAGKWNSRETQFISPNWRSILILKSTIILTKQFLDHEKTNGNIGKVKNNMARFMSILAWSWTIPSWVKL